ncbi:MAG TPA: H-type lectin domain-containing protein [Paracoccus sp. (in: a-proteobacteria)]|nr:H-type lectin domain-containing protein [Paracoccus sp. (in: a-proteobacteria)]
MNLAETGVSQGSLVLFSDFENDGPMWAGQGPRSVRRIVVFDRPFLDSPAVHVGLGMWDIAGGANQRVDVLAEDVTAEGFVIRFQTWGDTRIARVRADWLAIGRVPHPDDFDVPD